MSDAYEAFERDVPEHLRDDAMQMMAEATGGYGSHESVTILDRDQLDAINFRASGIIRIEGEEYTFQMEDGNRNGTDLLAWQSDRQFEYHQPTRWAVQPRRDIIYRHISEGKGPFLLAKWGAVAKNRDMADLIRKYSYDRFFQPGGLVERHYRELADKHGFEIVTQETADETKAMLAKATQP